MSRTNIALGLIGCLMLCVVATPAAAIDDDHRTMANASIAKGLAYFKKAQNPDGSWTPRSGKKGTEMMSVAITGLIVRAMLLDPKIDHTDATVRKGLNYLLSMQQKDGGIYNRILANYQTSIALMALGPVRNKDLRYQSAITQAQTFLKTIQSAQGHVDAKGDKIDENHPHRGGLGYHPDKSKGSKHGRPDLNNTVHFIKGMIESGYNCNDPAIREAIIFAARLQGVKSSVLAEQIEPGGGFIYAPSTDEDNIGTAQSQAGTYIDSAGKSRLRAYGTMTYAGFMAFILHKMPADDPRMTAAYEWIQTNYTLEYNPGMVNNSKTNKDERHQGYYYYLHLFSRGLRAWTEKDDRKDALAGKTVVVTSDGKSHDWANEIIAKVASLQRKDGSWTNTKNDRWMESDEHLASAYAILALRSATQTLQIQE
jgi:hypothetical protein